MAEYQTCYEGCRCSECRQRRSDYFYLQEFRSLYGIEEEYAEDTTLNRLENAMDSMGYSSDIQRSIRNKYKHT